MLALTMANVKLVGASRYVHVHISSPVALARNRNPFTFVFDLKIQRNMHIYFFRSVCRVDPNGLWMCVHQCMWCVELKTTCRRLECCIKYSPYFSSKVCIFILLPKAALISFSLFPASPLYCARSRARRMIFLQSHTLFYHTNAYVTLR